MTTVLTLEGLSTHFSLRTGLLRAVENVSFTLAAGRTTCVVGESGSGKSVTARSILNIVQPPGRIVAGRVLLHRDGDAVDLVAFDPRGAAIRQVRGREIAMIFQEPMSSLSPVHRIGFQIEEALRLHTPLDKRARRARAIELLAQVEIPVPEKAVDRYPFEYSGGMRQRAMIAMALACDPRVLIADEPTTALDVTTQAEILDLIRRLQSERGMAVLFITHDMGVVAEIADEVVVMFRGEAVEQGPVDRIFHAPEHPYTRMLIDTARRLERRAAAKPDQPSRSAPSILEVSGLSKRFASAGGFFRRRTVTVDAVRAVDLTLAEGETLGIVGESGSGKTTLGRCLIRMIDPTDGAVRYRQANGRVVDLARLDRRSLRPLYRDIRMIFQDPHGSLNPRMTVGQIVGEPLRNIGWERARIARRVSVLLEMVGLQPNHAERYPHAFSGGQRQRIGIARALAPEPRLIIADEATSALDVSLRAQVLDLLIDLQNRLGLSFIFISHDIGVIRYFTDRVAVMFRGEVVETGPTSEVCERPTHPYTQALISAVPKPDPRQRGIALRRRYAPETSP
jgi:peptide/nickel transport system ATP-binding protein